MLHNLIYQMFPTYPRRIGQFREIAHSFADVEKFIMQTNGVGDCFIELFDSSRIIDKIMFDIDSAQGFIHSRKTAEKLYTYLSEINLNPLITCTGSKGYHIYVPLVPTRNANAKDLLNRAARHIIDEALGNNNEQVDYSVVGDIGQLDRIFNTLRPPKNLSWCVLLPENWHTLTARELVLLTKEPNYISADWLPSVKLTDLPLAEEDELDVEYNYVSSGSSNYDEDLTLVQNILKMSLKPCLYKLITEPNPRHFVRSAAAAELLQNYTVDDAVWILSRLRWMDFDSTKTRKQLNTWVGGHPWSCKKLRSSGIDCTQCEIEVLA